MDSRIEGIATEYRSGLINRRMFFQRLIAVGGSYSLAHHLLETSGLAMSLISPAKSDIGNVESTAVKYPGEGVTLEGYFSRPKGNGPFPGFILIHENRGLNDHIRDVARHLASQGFATLAPDLLSRKGGTASFSIPEKATEAFGTVSDDDVIGDLNSSYDYLNSNATVRKDDIGVMGFCWGGQRSFLYATANAKFKGAVVFYGTTPPEDKLQRIACPVLANCGETDERIISKVPETKEQMKKLGKSYDAKIYPRAQHAFFNAERYNEAAAKGAWNRTLAFLKKNLG